MAVDWMDKKKWGMGRLFSVELFETVIMHAYLGGIGKKRLQLD